ncbi:MAG: choice-of-anchor B family protein [Micromonosporaceae bacterium]
MRTRLAIGTATALAVLLGLMGGAAYGHDFGSDDDVVLPSRVDQERQFVDMMARPDAADNAPRGFAPCVEGKAAGTYACSGIDQMSHLTLAELGLSFANDIWGWTDPDTGREYALIGGTQGTVFVDISDPKRPDVVGIVPTNSTAGGQFWRDIKVYANHAYIGSEHTDHGMQVFDLTRLRGVTGVPKTFAADYVYTGIGSSHNININERTGFAYVIGSRTCAGGLHMVDLSNPKLPTFAGCFAEHGYIHDTQCVVYAGPDRAHRGREICVNSAATFNDFSPEGIVNTVTVVDVTDKANPVSLSRLEYPNDGYSHQGWLTPDQKYFLHNDELDEFFHGVNTTNRIFDMRDLDAISVSAVTDNGQTSIGHNIYTEGNRAYASNYTTGLRVFDTSNVAAGQLPEVGYFDLYPENDNATFEGGTWSNYPYYKQKVVAVSSMDRGLFILKPRGTVGA